MSLRILFLREDDTAPEVDGRTLAVRILTYDRPYGRGVRRERVRPGSFKAPIARPSGLVRWRHVGERDGDIDDPMYIYGAVRGLREESGTLVAEAELLPGERADQLLELVKSKSVKGVSMSAIIAEERPGSDAAGPLTDVTRVASFNGFSLTPSPMYDDAEVLALREDKGRPVTRAELDAARAQNAAARAYLASSVTRWRTAR